jgi:hypothetical protein
VCFSPDGSRLAGAGNDEQVRVWDAKTGREILTLLPTTNGPGSEALGSRRLREHLSQPVKFNGFEADPNMTLRNVLDHIADRFDLPFDVNEAAFEAERVRGVLSKPVAEKPIPKMVNVSVDTLLRKILARVPAQSGVTYVIRRDRIEITTGAYALRGRAGFGGGLCFSPDGSRLAGASDENTVKVWDAATGREALTLKGRTYAVDGLCFSPDGSRLAGASDGNTVKVWDARTGQEALALRHDRPVRCVCFSPDGHRLASASDDGTVKVWDATLPKEAPPEGGAIPGQ